MRFALGLLFITVAFVPILMMGPIALDVARYKTTMTVGRARVVGCGVLAGVLVALGGGLTRGFSLSEGLRPLVVFFVIGALIAVALPWFVRASRRSAKFSVRLPHERTCDDIPGALLGYRFAAWTDDTLSTWHTSGEVRTHTDMIHRGEALRFIRRYVNDDVYYAKSLAVPQHGAHVGVCVQQVLGDTRAYVDAVLDSAPLEYARIARSSGLTSFPCSVIVPTSSSSPAPLDLTLPGVFPLWEVESFAWGGTVFEWASRACALEYEPRAIDLARMLLREFGEHAALVYPIRTPVDGFRGGASQSCLLNSTDDVARRVLEAMIGLPFIGFVVDASVGSEVARLHGVQSLGEHPQSVLGLVIGVFDGESFAVVSR